MIFDLPEEDIVIQEVLGKNVRQRKVRVHGHEQDAKDRNQLEAIQTRHPARQVQGARLFQPIHVRLEAKERAFRVNGGNR